MSLINLAEPSYLWKTKEKGDLVQLYVTMIGTMLLGPILGVIIAICLAVLGMNFPRIFLNLLLKNEIIFFIFIHIFVYFYIK